MRRALLDVTPVRTSPAFLRLWLGRTLSALGGQMAFVAVMFQMWQQTGSTVWTGAVGIAQAVPMLGFGLFAGSLVDRFDRRRCFLVAAAGQAACSAVLAVQGFAALLPPAGLLVLVASQSCCSAAGGPAARTFIPRLLPREQIAAGLALNRVGQQAAGMLGPAAGGLVVASLGVGVCHLVDSVSFAAAFCAVLALPAMRPGDGAARPGLRGVVDGLAFLVRAPVVRGALLTDLAATVLSMPVSLFPLVNAQRFGGDPRGLGLFLTAIAVGGVVASLLSGTFTRSARPGRVMVVGALAWGGALAAFGLSPDRWLALAFLVAAGAADTVAVVARSTIVQTHTPDELLGRVSAAELAVGIAGPDLGNLRGGLVAAVTSGPVALVTGGLACVAAVGVVAATTPDLRGAAVGRRVDAT